MLGTTLRFKNRSASSYYCTSSFIYGTTSHKTASTETVFSIYSIKTSEKFDKIHWKPPVPECIYSQQNEYNEIVAQVFLRKFN